MQEIMQEQTAPLKNARVLMLCTGKGQGGSGRITGGKELSFEELLKFRYACILPREGGGG